MAKNREPEKPVESESESGEEENEASSEEVESSASDSEPEQGQNECVKMPLSTPAPKKSQPESSSKPQQPSPSSDEEESGSESDSDGPGPDVRPLASKPMDDPQKSAAARKPRSKPTAKDTATPAKPTAAKRPAEGKETEAKDNKRLKKKPESEPESLGNKSIGSNDDSKKLLFQRLWSEDDEIVVLKGMIDYAAKKRSDPIADLNAFHDFIKKNLHVDVTRVQLQDKIRRLKKKYENNKSKVKEGKDRTFLKPHEQKSYELSKSIWGKENGKETGVEKVVGSPKENGSAVRKTPSKRVKAVKDGDTKEVKSVEVANGDMAMLAARRLTFNSVGMEESVLRTGAELFEGDKKVEGEREWRKLRLEEMELQLKKLDLLRAQTKLVLDVLKSTEH